MADIISWESFIRIHGGEVGARDIFEQLIYALLRNKYKGFEVHNLQPVCGDGGIDVYVAKDNEIDIYQCKFFMDRLNTDRWKKIKHSYESAIKSIIDLEAEGMSVLNWYCCMPKRYEYNDIKEINKFKKARESDGIKIRFLDGSDIIQELLAIRENGGIDLLKEYFYDKSAKDLYEQTYTSLKKRSELIKLLKDRLIKDRNDHPSIRLMKPDEDLYPQGFIYTQQYNVGLFERQAKCTEEQTTQSISYYIQKSWTKPQNHLLIEGRGGIGKTVALLNLTTEIDFLPIKVPAIYVPMYRLNDYSGTTVIDCISEFIKSLFPSDTYDMIRDLSLQPWENGPKLILLLDGFNEVYIENRARVERSINDTWAKRSGVQIITTSRFWQSFQHSFTHIILQPLDKSVIKNYLQKVKVPLPKDGSAIWDVITLPLLLTMYVQIEKVRQASKDVIYFDWREPDSAGAIVWNYLQKELHNCLKRYAALNQIPLSEYAFGIIAIAPYICWNMSKNQKFRINSIEINKLIESAINLYLENKELIPLQVENIMRRNCDSERFYLESLCKREDWLFDILTNSVRLFKEQSGDQYGNVWYVPMHQNFRDALAAIHVYNMSMQFDSEKYVFRKASLKKISEITDYYVLKYYSEIADYILLEEAWEINRKSDEQNDHLLRNLLSIYGWKRNNNFEQLDFSGLDLSRIFMGAYHENNTICLKLPHEKEQFKKTILSMHTFSSPGHSQSVQCIAVTKDGKYCISASKDKTIRVWDIVNAVCIRTIAGLNAQICDIYATNDSNFCMSVSYDYSINIWHNELGSCLYSMYEVQDKVNNVIMTNDGSRCIAASRDGKLFSWQLEEYKRKKEYDVINRYFQFPTNCKVAISPKEEFILCADEFFTVGMWTTSLKRIRRFKGHKSIVNVIAIAPNGEYFVSADQGGVVLKHSLMNKEEPYIEQLKYSSKNSGVEFSELRITSNSQKCIGAKGNQFIIWDFYYKSLIEIDNVDTKCFDLTPDNKYLVGLANNTTIAIWDLDNAHEIHRFVGHTGSINYLKIYGRGSKCLSASDDKTIGLWDLDARTKLYTLQGNNSSIKKLILSNSGKRLVTVQNDGTVRLWVFDSTHKKFIITNIVQHFSLYKIKNTDRELTNAVFENDSHFVIINFDSSAIKNISKIDIVDIICGKKMIAILLQNELVLIDETSGYSHIPISVPIDDYKEMKFSLHETYTSVIFNQYFLIVDNKSKLLKQTVNNASEMYYADREDSFYYFIKSNVGKDIVRSSLIEDNSLERIPLCIDEIDYQIENRMTTLIYKYRNLLCFYDLISMEYISTFIADSKVITYSMVSGGSYAYVLYESRNLVLIDIRKYTTCSPMLAEVDPLSRLIKNFGVNNMAIHIAQNRGGEQYGSIEYVWNTHYENQILIKTTSGDLTMFDIDKLEAKCSIRTQTNFRDSFLISNGGDIIILNYS